jgi:hypothetical protein
MTDGIPKKKQVPKWESFPKMNESAHLSRT